MAGSRQCEKWHLALPGGRRFSSEALETCDALLVARIAVRPLSLIAVM